MKNPNYYKEVKEHIDSIYEKTFDGEYIGTWKQFNCRLLEECVTELISRGIMTKTPYQRIGARGRHYTFHWIASSKPTNHLAVSIGDAIRHKQATRRDAYREKMKKWKQKENPAAAVKSTSFGETVPAEYNTSDSTAHNIAACEKVALSQYTDSQLWEELKSRGYEIENGRLVIITRKYLD